MNKHSPGPWKGIESISDASGKAVCDVAVDPWKPWELNAKLIVAAPLMLEALRAARQYSIDSGISYPSVVDIAITKATGVASGRIQDCGHGTRNQTTCSLCAAERIATNADKNPSLRRGVDYSDPHGDES